MSRKIEAVILDWAGTSIDFGSFAPVASFQKAFEKINIYPSVTEIREPMGLEKKLHITHMFQNENLKNEFENIFNRKPEQKDIDTVYSYFEPSLFQTLEQYTTPIDGVLETIDEIRNKGIKIGSTTGYNSKMMNIVVPSAEKQGYFVDCLVCPDEVENLGRPYPYMIWKNLQKLKIKDIRNVIKLGDTAADMEEGKNAGCIAVGILKGSNMLGMSYEEYQNCDKEVLIERKEQARNKFLLAGADYVIDNITELESLIENISKEII